VVVDEFESAVEILIRVLRQHHVDGEAIETTVREARRQGYQWMWPYV
jgi:hypothetical protein